jgi:YidC/Oxa1 family membrane protein insertase
MMAENLRPVLWLGAALLIWACFQTWQQDYAPRLPPAAAAAGGTAGAPERAVDHATPGTAGGTAVSPPAAAAQPAKPALPPVHVRTDVLDVKLDLVGGDLRAAALPTYPVHKDRPDVPVELLAQDAARLFVFHSGLTGPGAQPDGQAVYRAEQSEYQLADGANELAVRLLWESDSGVRVEKTLTFRRGSYEVDVAYRIHNGSAAPYRAASYLQIERRHLPPARSYFNVDSYSFTGPVAYNGEKYEKIKLEKLADEPFRHSAVNGWIASIQHHFLAAAVPAAGESWLYDIRWDGSIYTLSATGPARDIPAGEDGAAQARLFVGPKLQSQLAATAPGLALTVDYGALTILAQPLFWLLQKIHLFVGNWGWAIIIATFLIKLAFYKLTEASGRSMAKMRKIQPRLKALQDRHKDDRAALSQAMMELYKKEKVNPAAGCLPMLIQIPFFIAYYWVLLESVEMRQAPFALWISDLSSRDPYFVLPLLMGVAMFVQQSLNPAPPDPVQAKIMKIMPVMFTVFFAFFPAGLVIYWLTNSILSILQQWRINKVLAAD